MQLTLGWLYSDLMNTYGDRGNVKVIVYRAEKRKLKLEVKELSIGSNYRDILACDLLFMGGAEDRQQKIVAADLVKDKHKALAEKINRGTPGLYICGAYQFLGEYYQTADGIRLKCLNILPFYTISPSEKNNKRLIGDIVVKITNNQLLSSIHNSDDTYLVGFENHGGRTYLSNNRFAIGRVIKGFGNNEKDANEGYVFKNTIGTYLHGPILPRNPALADLLLEKAIELKYNQKVSLKPLEDQLELTNRKFLLKTLNVKNN